MDELLQLATDSGDDGHGEHSREVREGLEHWSVDLLFAAAPGDAPAAADPVALAAALEQAGHGDLTLAPPSASEDPTRPEAADAATPAALARRLGSAVDASILGVSRDVGAPPRWLLSRPAPFDRLALGDALSQSWWWPEAEAVLAGCRSRRRLVDDRMLGLDHKGRLRRMQQVLAACIEALRPEALHWPASEQLVEPSSFLASVREDDFRGLLPGAVNVRFFRLEYDGEAAGGEGHAELLMDTRGLSELGLIDLQCHFRGLDPEAVSRVLYSTAAYLFAEGRVIVAGNTVQGPGPRDAWLVRAGQALAPPRRPVLDLDPGFPFAAAEYPDSPAPDDETPS
ncbi:MAG: DUF4261 domain-containing protein [Acidobacteria bacterium]|nr:MAG: DUF4261 domain-containing protein [Acidobacteriota bacterium]REK04272.1 MAG: DUF4261 domain-containing protein [Acidobacteriota bacterium]